MIKHYVLDPDPNRQFSKIEKDSLFQDGKLHPSITVIGKRKETKGKVYFLKGFIFKVIMYQFQVKLLFLILLYYHIKNLDQARRTRLFYKTFVFL
jgi:hypothetical protein